MKTEIISFSNSTGLPYSEFSGLVDKINEANEADRVKMLHNINHLELTLYEYETSTLIYILIAQGVLKIQLLSGEAFHGKTKSKISVNSKETNKILKEIYNYKIS